MDKKTTIILLALLLPVFVFGQTTNVSSIGTDSCGGTCDYSTISAWEAATDTGLVAGNVIEKGELWNDGDFSAGATIDGATTDATRYRILTSNDAEKGDGTEGTGPRITGDSNDVLDGANEDFVRISYIEITNWGSATGARNAVTTGSGADDWTVHHMLIHTPSNTSSLTPIAIRCANGAADWFIYRNMIYNINLSNTANEVGISSSRGATVNNNTVYNALEGFASLDATGDGVLKNNISVGNTTDYADSYGNGSDFNVDEDGTAPGDPGTNNVTTSQTLDGTFFADLVDFFLISGSNAVDAGVDLSSPYDVDITGFTVTGTWDIGAHELQVAATRSRFIGVF